MYKLLTPNGEVVELLPTNVQADSNIFTGRLGSVLVWVELIPDPLEIEPNAPTLSIHQHGETRPRDLAEGVSLPRDR